MLSWLDTGSPLACVQEVWVATTQGAITVALVAGIVAALIATFLVDANATRRRKRRLKASFGSLAGDYDIRRKLDNKLLPELARITVNENILQVTYFVDEATVVEGEIEMNEQFPRSGRGHYHDYRQAPDHLWGFWEIQVSREGEILQHTTYANANEHKEVVSGFVWTPRGRQHAHPKLFNPTPRGGSPFRRARMRLGRVSSAAERVA